MRKSASLLAMLLLFAVVLFSFSKIEAVKAQYWSIIVIRADGTVEGTDKIQREGNVYTFTEDISGSIKVERNFTVIDGAGYTLLGSEKSRGIDLKDYSSPSLWIVNVTVKNLCIKNFEQGIFSGFNNTFIGNYIVDCFTGIDIVGGANNRIENNTFENNGNPISISYSKADYITHNNFVGARNTIIVWLSAEPIVDRNYWGDYNGTDSNGDGIGDSPYTYIYTDYAKCVDTHALMEPPVPILPEFPSWTPLLILLFSVAVVAVIISYRNGLSKQNQGRKR